LDEWCLEWRLMAGIETVARLQHLVAGRARTLKVLRLVAMVEEARVVDLWRWQK
jgi:hypothetical protein